MRLPQPGPPTSSEHMSNIDIATNQPNTCKGDIYTKPIERHHTKLTIFFPALNTTCKSPQPYPYVAIVNSVDRKPTINPPQHKNTKQHSQHPPLQSPYTCVYGMRGIFDTTLSISNPKLRKIQNHISQKMIMNNTTSSISTITTIKPKHTQNKLQIAWHSKRFTKTNPNITQTKHNLLAYKQIPNTKNPPSTNPYTRVYGKRRNIYKNATQNKLSTNKVKLSKKIKTKKRRLYKTNSTPYIKKTQTQYS